MNTATTKRPQVAVKSITIDRAEGPVELCTKTEHTTWASANKRLRDICATAPKNGGYDKCDFKVVFADGETYEGRYDAAHPQSSSYEPANVGEHIRAYLTFQAGLRCPPHMSEEEYETALANTAKHLPNLRKEALAFLVKYALDDLPVNTDDGRKAQHISDAAAPVVAAAQGFCDPAFLRKLDAAEKGIAALVADLDQATTSRPDPKLGAMGMQLRKALLAIMAAKGIK